RTCSERGARQGGRNYSPVIWRTPRQIYLMPRIFAWNLAIPSLNRSSAVVTDTPRSFPQIVLHNLKLAADIDHQRDDPSHAPSEPRPPPIVRENGSGGLVRQ